MPKKNAFYFFMLQRQAELKEEGKAISLTKIPGMLNDEWKIMSAEEKAMYKKMATQHNSQKTSTKLRTLAERTNLPYEDVSSNGGSAGSQPSLDLEQELMMMTDAEIEELHKIDFSPNGQELTIRLLMAELPKMKYDKSTPIVLINVSYYNKLPWIPAEVAMCAFSVERGIYANYATLVDPKEYPEPMEDVVSANAKLLALPMPNYEKRLQNYAKMISHFAFFINSHSRRFFGNGVLFCLSQDMEKVDACLKWIFKQAGDGFSFKLLSLETLAHYLSTMEYMDKMADEVYEDHNKLMQLQDEMLDFEGSPTASYEEVEVFGTRRTIRLLSTSNKEVAEDPKPTEFDKAIAKMVAASEGILSYPLQHPLVQKGIFLQPKHVVDFLQLNNYACYEELACLYHLKRWDGVPHCAMNITNRYAYNLLHVLVKIFGVIPEPGIHYPTINEDNYLLERQRRIDMLNQWETTDYTELAQDEKLRDEELPETQRFNVKRFSELKRTGKIKRQEDHYGKRKV